MQTKKVIICDDEQDARVMIKQYLEDFSNLEIAAECKNGEEAIEAINRHTPDLIFLDIQMPVLNGFQVLQQISHIPQVIFSTAYDNYAVKAFESNAVDYLLKPYTKDRFNKAVTKVLSNIDKNLQSIRSLNDDIQAQKSIYTDTFFVQSSNKLISIKTDDIFSFEAQGDYSGIQTVHQQSFLSNYGIGALEQKLNPAVFQRIHRSTIINLNHIREILKADDGYKIILTNGSSHKVSRSYKDVIKKISI
jgi:two-component system, LytTR family, response regulator